MTQPSLPEGIFISFSGPLNIKLIVLMQRIRGIFYAAKFFNDRGGRRGGGAEG